MLPIPEIRVTIVQPDVVWENKTANLNQLDKIISSAEPSDLIVLPEMFSTGFSMRPDHLAETVKGETVQWLRNLASNQNCVVTGSLIIEDGGKYYNRLIWMRPNGTFEVYDKRHLFSFANEEKYYSAGNERLIVELKGWRFCPMICYDLRFPVWSRNQSLSGDDPNFAYDVLIYVANWPEVRKRPWTNLLEARAHENQAYVIGVNRVGLDGNGINHSGNSAVFDPKGFDMAQIEDGKEALKTVVLSYENLASYRQKFTAWKDKDRFTLGE